MSAAGAAESVEAGAAKSVDADAVGDSEFICVCHALLGTHTYTHTHTHTRTHIHTYAHTHTHMNEPTLAKRNNATHSISPIKMPKV